jgi:xanthine dehydrogenase accessory factor
MLALASAFKSKGKSVMLSTTTHLSRHLDYGVDCISDGFSSDVDDDCRSLLLVSGGSSSEQYCSPGTDRIRAFSKMFDKIIIEADGSRNLPLKYHSDSEPVIPDFSSAVISMLGLDSLGRRLADVLHRYELYESEYGVAGSEKAGLEDIENLISSPYGSLCGVGASMGRFVFLNKFDVLACSCCRGEMLDDVVGLSQKMGCYLVSVRDKYVVLPA